MSIIVVSTPDKTVNGLDSNVNAAISQLPYEFRREDNNIDTIFSSNIDATKIRVFILGVQHESNYNSGDHVFVNSPNVDPTRNYVGIYTIDFVDNDGVNTRLYMIDNNAFLGASGIGGYTNNLTTRPNYKLVIEILDEDELSDNALIDFNFRYAAEQNGRIFIDVAQILTDYLKFAELVSQEYRLQYWETWTGVESKGIETAVSAVVNAGGFCNVATTPEPWQVGQEMLLDSTAVYPNVPGVITSIEPGGFICDIAFVSITASGFVRTPNSFDITAIIQAIAARKQQGLQGGSNLWEHLLRVGMKQPKNIDKWVNSGNEVDWILQESERWRIQSPFDISILVNILIVGSDMPASNMTVRFQYQAAATGNTSGVIRMGNIVNGLQKGTSNFPLVTGQDNFHDVVFINDTAEPNTWGLKPNPATADGLCDTFVIYSAEVLSTEAKLLTKFKEPLIWRGWSRSISILRDSNYNSRVGESGLFFRYRGVDINKNNPSGSTTRQVLPGEPGLYSDEIEQHFIGIYEKGFTEVFATGSVISLVVSESVYYKQLEPCRNPIMIEWINSLGAPESHLFSFNQEVNNEASSGLAYETPHSIDQEQIKGDKKRIFSESTQSMLLISEGLTPNQITALAEIKTSDEVFVYLTKDGSEKIRVIVRDLLGSNYETRNQANNEFRLAIEFPNNYDFFYSKLY